MFLPIGGVFVFGGCDSPACVVNRIFMGFFNLIMGAIALGFGYAQDLNFLKIIGYVIGGMGLLMILFNTMRLRKARSNTDAFSTTPKQDDFSPNS
jgi:hypothetical protein